MCASYTPTEQKRRRAVTSQADDISPFVIMDEVLEKLKMLNYEQDFSRKLFIFDS